MRQGQVSSVAHPQRKIAAQYLEAYSPAPGIAGYLMVGWVVVLPSLIPENVTQLLRRLGFVSSAPLL
jgi:hypothetical protein